MPKNLNSFILTDNIIEIMEQKLKKTEEINRELGFNLCKIFGSNELKDDTHCIGSECRIPLEKTCKTGIKVGTYHTHTKQDSTPSLPDLWGGYYHGIEYIGGTDDQKITCYVRKDKDRDPKINKVFAANSLRFESLGAGKKHSIKTQRGYQIYMSKFRDLQYTRDALLKGHFYTVNIKE
jgi:hypothetical protein